MFGLANLERRAAAFLVGTGDDISDQAARHAKTPIFKETEHDLALAHHPINGRT